MSLVVYRCYQLSNCEHYFFQVEVNVLQTHFTILIVNLICKHRKCAPYTVHLLLTVGFGELHRLPVNEKSIGRNYVAKYNMTAFGKFPWQRLSFYCAHTHTKATLTQQQNMIVSHVFESLIWLYSHTVQLITGVALHSIIELFYNRTHTRKFSELRTSFLENLR